jgi:hypothetical protein
LAAADFVAPVAEAVEDPPEDFAPDEERMSFQKGMELDEGAILEVMVDPAESVVVTRAPPVELPLMVEVMVEPAELVVVTTAAPPEVVLVVKVEPAELVVVMRTIPPTPGPDPQR